MSRDPRERSPLDRDRRLAELLAFLSPRTTAGEDPDAATARRIESAVAADPSLARELLEDPELDRLLRGEKVVPPSELEWARVDAAISAATGVAVGTAASGRGGAALRPRPRLLRARLLAPIAAGLLLGAFVIREAFVGGLAPAAEATIVEVDLPDDRAYLIVAGENEADGVMIFIGSS